MEAKRIGIQSDESPAVAREIPAEMRPIMPVWQMLLGSLVFVLGIGNIYPPSFDLQSLAFWGVLLLAITIIVTFLLRKKTLKVWISREGDSTIIRDSRGPAALIASRVEPRTSMSFVVERKGRRMELKRMELHFSNAQDAAKAISLIRATQTSRF